MAKNSFSLLETILAVCILTLLVSGFSKFTYAQPSLTQEIQNVSNDWLTPQPSLEYQNSSLGFSQQAAMLYFTATSGIEKSVYKSETLLMNKYTLKQTSFTEPSSKVFP